MKTATSCLSVGILFLFLGMIAIITSIAGPSWYVDANSTMYGLWKRCESESIFNGKDCKTRKVFKFQKIDFELDMILALMCGSAFFAIIGIICAISMCCCRNSRKSWIGCALLNCLLTIISVGCAVGGLVYNEISAEHQYKSSYKRGWSAVVSFVGAGLLFLGIIFFTSMFCINPKREVPDIIELKLNPSGRFNKSYQS